MKIIISIIVVESMTLILLLAYLYYKRGGSNVRGADRFGPAPLSTTIPNSPLNPLLGFAGSGHCSFISDWQQPEQHDDRQLMNGSVSATKESNPSVRRAFARKSHQLMYKKWSKERHD